MLTVEEWATVREELLSFEDDTRDLADALPMDPSTMSDGLRKRLQDVCENRIKDTITLGWVKVDDIVEVAHDIILWGKVRDMVRPS